MYKVSTNVLCNQRLIRHPLSERYGLLFTEFAAWRVDITYTGVSSSSSSSSLKFLEWPKQQRHHEDH